MADNVPLYKRRAVQVAAIVIALPMLALAWWLGSPLFLDTEVNEDFPRAATAEIPDDMTRDEVEAKMVEAEAETVSVDDAMPDSEDQTAQMSVIATGSLMDADSSHRGSGQATVYELDDGSRVLRLEDIDVTNGPDLHVIITPLVGVDGRDDVHAVGYLDLGSLKGNIGSQNYDIPADYEIPEEFTVVIYCAPFHVIFATAELG